jgi:hypothetical protein
MDHWSSPIASRDWKAYITKLRQEYSLRVKSAHLTKGKECLSWPTVTANEDSYRIGGESQQSKCLSAMARRGEMTHGPAAPANPSTDGSRLEPQEEWKMLPGWGDKYQVSNHGRIQSKASGDWKEMTLTIKDTGYPNASLRHDGKQKKVTIHILVAMLFLGERPDGLVINHIDGNKLNNCVWNLEYVTAAENNRHAQIMGLNCTKEEMNPMAKLNKIQVEEILQSKEPQSVIARRMNVCQQTISLIRSGKRWKGLSQGLWATPNCMDVLPPKSPEALARNLQKGGCRNLREDVVYRTGQWGTPAANDANKTPHCEVNSNQAGLAKSVGLEMQRQWATPRSCSAMAATIMPESANKENRFPNLETQVGRRQMSAGKLNGQWVCALMGLPMGWVTPSCPASVIRNWPKFVSGWCAVTIALTSYDSWEMGSCPQPQNELFEC